jgi:hypothetical protein
LQVLLLLQCAPQHHCLLLPPLWQLLVYHQVFPQPVLLHHEAVLPAALGPVQCW